MRFFRLSLFFALFLFSCTFGIVLWSEPIVGETVGEPLVFYGQVIVTSSDGKIYSFRIEDGQINWIYDLQERVFFGAKKYDENNLVALTESGKMFFISSNGRLIWSKNLGAFPDSFVTSKNKIFVSVDSNLESYNRFGNKTWEKKGIGSGILALGQKNLYLISSGVLYSIDQETGKINWQTPSPDLYAGAPVEYNDFVYLGGIDGILYCFNATTGEKKWTFETSSWINTPLLIDESGIYFGTTNKKIYKVDFEGNLIFEKQESLYQAKMVTYKSKQGKVLVYSSEDNKINAISAENGSFFWSFSPYGKAEDLTVAYDMIIFGTNKGKVYAISPSILCIFLYPKNFDTVGNWIVDIEGEAVAENGVKNTEIRVVSENQEPLTPWIKVLGKERWFEDINFSSFPEGIKIIQCKVTDQLGKSDTKDFSSILLIKMENAPLQKLKVEMPKKINPDEEFNISVKNSLGFDLKNVKITIDGVESIGNSPFKVKIPKNKQSKITIEKSGFETEVFQINTLEQQDNSWMFALIFFIIGAAIIYFLVKKFLI